LSAERRVGIGYDAHRFGDGGTLVLGGVEIPDVDRLEGHSDADVLAHAVTDALLGASGLGDIGRHFPDDDPRYRDADSIELLAEVVGLVTDGGWHVGNVDSTVVCERPRLEPFALAMRERLAQALRVGAEAVSVKATTNEGMGAIGRGEGIAAFAVAQLERSASGGGG
jgi:2-C-methyl-D-erythritol 2,4-cyclodiphosphate synthase